MDVEVNWLAIVIATIVGMAVGAFWYAPKVFGKAWIILAKLDPKQQTAKPRSLVIGMIASLLSAYIIAHVTYISNDFFGNSFLQDAISTAFWLWLGMTAARFALHDAFEGRPAKLTVITAGHDLMVFLAMAVVIGLIKP